VAASRRAGQDPAPPGGGSPLTHRLVPGRPEPGGPDVPVLHVAGEVDLATAPALRDALGALLADGAAARVVVDLSAVTFLASSGLAALLEAHQRACASGRALRVVVAERTVWRVLEVTGLVRVLDCHASLREALDAPA
jgi:anti-sigma B factor antagonist